MIGGINGVCLHEEHGLASFAVGELVYEVHVFDIPHVYDPSNPGQTNYSELWWIHEHAPQDAPHELYGFREREQRDLFRRLLNVKAVGPTVAMRIVGSGWQPGTPLPKIRGVGDKIAAQLATFA